MTEIESFNQLMAQAKLSSVRLNSFCQLDSGTFRANWRRGEKFFDCVENPLPFLALRDSFLLATGQEGRVTPSSFEDVFG
jgi:hypothetical protein